MADRAALLIAVENFFEMGRPLPYAAADCTELARVLPEAGYNPAKCWLLSGTRTTKAAIVSYLKRLPTLVGQADSLLVLVVSRGFSVGNRGYLVCADTILPDPTGTALAMRDLLLALEGTTCPEVAVLIDAESLAPPGEPILHEPILPGLDASELESLFKTSSRAVGLLSCEPGSRSHESVRLRRGIWRHHLIEALAGRARTVARHPGRLSAVELQEHLAEAVPRTLRRTYDPPHEQTPVQYGESNGEVVVAEWGDRLRTESVLLDADRICRVSFRSESVRKVRELAGFRRSHSLPNRANEWASKFVRRIAAPDIKADLDEIFERIRETFGYKRKEIEVGGQPTGLGLIRTPDFEYSVSVRINPHEPTEAIWQREVARLAGAGLIRSAEFRQLFGPIFDQLVFEFRQKVDVAAFIDQIEDNPPPGVRLGVVGEGRTAELSLAGYHGSIRVTPEAVIIRGQAGRPDSLFEQFLAFLQKFAGLGEPPGLPSA